MSALSPAATMPAITPAARSIAAIYPATREDLGGLIARCPLSLRGPARLDPFLRLVHFGPQSCRPYLAAWTCGTRPYRGIEAVSMVLAGTLTRRDRDGRCRHGAGDVQWLTAGAGMTCGETLSVASRRAEGQIEMLQLWINLPARLKTIEPSRHDVAAADLPTLPLAGDAGELRLLAGDFDGASGPVRSPCSVFLAIVHLRAGALAQLPAPSRRSVLLYLVRGELAIAGMPVEAWRLVEMNADGDRVLIEAKSEALLLFGHAERLDEPLAADGAMVMNTPAELAAAFRDFSAGRFEGGS